MCVYEHIAYFASGITLLDQIAQGEEVACRLRHLLAVDAQVGAMHPRLYERLAGRGLRLGDFILVMGKEVVYAAGMQIECLA